jgi:hypothetical protein
MTRLEYDRECERLLRNFARVCNDNDMAHDPLPDNPGHGGHSTEAAKRASHELSDFVERNRRPEWVGNIW